MTGRHMIRRRFCREYFFSSLLGGMAVIKGERVSLKKRGFQISVHIHLLYRMPDPFSLATTDLFPKKL